MIESGAATGSTLGQLLDAHSGEILGSQGKESRDFPLLLKLLFPQKKLSVQVHPDDRMAQLAGEPRGKTECWYVLSAEPGAGIALGLHPGTTEEAIRDAIANCTLEHLLEWIPVHAGETIYVDAGTVHSIGPGVVLMETQQYSDLTYRLYDYGRPRALHVDLALRALKLKTDAGKVATMRRDSYDELIRKQHFLVERHTVEAGQKRQMENGTHTAHALVALSGSALLQAPSAAPVELIPGRAILVPASVADYTVTASNKFICIRAMPPAVSR